MTIAFVFVWLLAGVYSLILNLRSGHGLGMEFKTFWFAALLLPFWPVFAFFDILTEFRCRNRD